MSFERIGDVLVAQGDGPGGSAAYRKGLAIPRGAGRARSGQHRVAARPLGEPREGRRRAGGPGRPAGALAPTAARRSASAWPRADPANTEWQRDLSVSHNKFGNVLRGPRRPAGALRRLPQRARGSARRWPRAIPANTGWQRDLSVSHNKIGDVLKGPGRTGRGRSKSYRKGLAISRGAGRARSGQRAMADRCGGFVRQAGEMFEHEQGVEARAAATCYEGATFS